ncbi:MAG: CusA/CzcA family heavy metal efflux RND transporter, partial [Burkholderiales bacterium PBB5]
GLEGKLFAPVELTIVCALSVSLLLSLTLVPVLASLLLRVGAAHEPWLMRVLNRGYAALLQRALGHERALYAGAGLGLAGAVLLLALVGKSFMPTLDEGDVIMQLEKLPSIGLEATVALDLRVQQAVLQRVPEVQAVVARSGADELGLDPMGLNQTDSFLVLKPRDQWRQPDKEWLIDQLRAVMADFPGVSPAFTQPIDMRVSEMLTGVRGDLAIKLYGPDLATLNQLAARIETTVAALPGASDTLTLRNDGVQYLQIRIDRQAAGRLGLNAESIQADLRRWVEGQPMGVVHEDGRRTPLVVRGPQALREAPADFEALRLTTPDGPAVPLAAVAQLQRVDGPVKVDRELAQRYVVVQSNVRGRDLVGFVADAQRAVAAQVPLPPGYRLAWGGQFENQQRA